MATQWYWRDGESTKGPVSFQELAEMVRDRHLNEDDLVRPHYSKETEWQTTDSVIGLYHMAERVPVPRKEEPPIIDEPAEIPAVADDNQFDDFDDMLALAEQIGDEEPAPNLADVSVPTRSPYFFTSRLSALYQRLETPKAQAVSLPVTLVRRTSDWIRKHQLISAIAAVVAIVGGGWTAHAIGRSADVQRFQELQQVVSSLEQQRVREQPEFAAVRQEIERIIREYPDALLREGASRQNPVKQQFLFISRDILPGLLKTDLKKRSVAEHHLVVRLDEVGKALGLR